jgi:alpha-mannosidase
VYVVAHTHWDREWYRGAGRFRHRLVSLVDELLDDPPRQGESFLLDGQAIVVEDYLAVRPERTAELATLLEEGRLEAGPWYVLADNLIPGGEALFRNLLAGRDALRALRANAPDALYCPDSFGHPAVLPDLAAGFACDLVIVWRGYGGARSPAGDAARWTSESGASVLLYHLAPSGYELGSSLPADESAATDLWRRLDALLRPRATLGLALLPNGADHHARQRGQREAVKSLASAADADVFASTLAGFGRAVREAARSVELPVVAGELRDSYGYTWTLGGTLATRTHQKRANALLERSLVRDAEPWLALGPAGGSASARATLRAAWRALLEGHPHDTLCGTSIDLVAAALDARHADVADRTEELRDEGLRSLAGHDAERARRAQPEWRPVVVVRNRTPRARGGVVELTLEATLADVAVGPGSATRQGPRREVPPWEVDGIALQLLETDERVALTESPRDYPDADLVATARAVGWMRAVAGYGVQTFAQGAARTAGGFDLPTPVSASDRMLDNGLMRIELSEAGTLRIVDRATGRVVDGALALEDARDVGDLYTPALRDALPAPELRHATLVHAGPLRAELVVEYRGGLSATEVVACRISLVLDAGAPFLRVHIDGRNDACDHRLRVRFATGLEGATTVADAAFRPVRRERLEIADADARMEHVVPTAPLHRYVSRYSANAGATIYSDGLAEYESFDDGAVAVTLVRAVGALSRHDLPERPGHAGWPADTPLAQSIGPYSARFAIALHGPDSAAQRDGVERIADDVLLPLVGETLRSNLEAPHVVGGLELDGDGLAFSAAMPARAAGWIVLRCVNRRDVAVQGAWRIARGVAEAHLARLDETLLEPLDVKDGTIRFTAPPNAIVTVLARAQP